MLGLTLSLFLLFHVALVVGALARLVTRLTQRLRNPVGSPELPRRFAVLLRDQGDLSRWG